MTQKTSCFQNHKQLLQGQEERLQEKPKRQVLQRPLHVCSAVRAVEDRQARRLGKEVIDNQRG